MMHQAAKIIEALRGAGASHERCRATYSGRRQREAGVRFSIAGFMLLEVLITAIIVAIGLLGLAKLQARSAIVQIESYQRTQALLLAQDMADRMLANKSNASAYIASDYGMRARSGCPGTGAQRDGCDWDAALRGASERVGATPVGTLRGGRGCINAIGARRYQVVVAWQGMLPTVAPQSDCARDRYGPDAHRRIVVVPVELPDLGAT